VRHQPIVFNNSRRFVSHPEWLNLSQFEMFNRRLLALRGHLDRRWGSTGGVVAARCFSHLSLASRSWFFALYRAKQRGQVT
jgi:hypothetical protein